MKNILLKLVALAGIIFSVWWGFMVLAPPTPESTDAPNDKFSALRAYQHIKQIAQRPHPVGTDEHRRVRNYLMQQFREMGLDPYLKSATAVRASGLTAASISNIMVMLEGQNPERTIVLMAHYDSVFYGPGAADDAGGVAAILETVQALKASDSLKHNVLVLLTDGEELGLLGANHFMKTYAALDSVELVINLEARGTSGQSFMFETNSGNNNLIPLFNKASRLATGNSFTFNIYNLLPNTTDFTVIKPHGVQGLNFAFIDDLVHYHTRLDNPGNLSLKSLQHQGTQLLESTRYIASTDDMVEGDRNLVYFNNPFGRLTYYTFQWSYLFVLLALALVISYNLISRKKHRKFIRGVSAVVLYGLIFMVALLAANYYLAKGIYAVNPQAPWLQQGELYEADLFFWGFLGMNIAAVTGFLVQLERFFRFRIMMAGLYSFIMTVILTLAYVLPGVNYLLVWPVIFGVGGLLLIQNTNQSVKNWRTVIIGVVSAFPALFLLGPYTKLLQTALTLQMVATGMLLVSFIIYICWPIWRFIIQGVEKKSMLLLAASALIIFVVAHWSSTFSAEKPKQNSLMYHHDFDKNETYWLSKDSDVDHWTKQYLGSSPKDTVLKDYTFFGRNKLLHNSAGGNEVTFQEPDFQIISDQRNGNRRLIELSVKSNFPANIGRFSLSDNSRLQRISINSKTIFNRDNPIEHQVDGFDRALMFTDQTEGYNLQLVVSEPGRAVRLRTTFYKTDFTKDLGSLYKPRNKTMIPKPFGFTHGMSWRKMVILEP